MKKQLSRNDICYCGSGKKYKKCCLNKDENKSGIQYIKRSSDFIAGMAKANRFARQTLEYVSSFLTPGITTKELEKKAHDFMLQHNARPATLNYQGYPASICTSINEVICHGIPSDRQLLSTDIINIDVSCELNGYYGDTSNTYNMGEASETAQKLIETTNQCLELGIEAAKPYSRIGDIGYAISKHAHKQGFSVVEQFVGHGIGTSFHEEPQVPHFGQKNQGLLILPGMIFTIEPMINEGEMAAKILDDRWTAVTVDRKLSAQFEHTILITQRGVRVLTAETDDMPLIPDKDEAEYH